MNRPDVTVVTPFRNRSILLIETIGSLTAQTNPNWELVLVDDGSTDEELAIIGTFIAADSRIRLFHRVDAPPGANSCRNLGMRHANAGLIVFLDSDDLLTPVCLETRIQIMERNRDLDFCVWQTGVFQNSLGDMTREFAPGLLGDDLMRFLFLECPWQTTAPIWRRDSLEKLGGWDVELPSWQDVDLHIRALCAGMKYLRFPGIDHYMRWAWDPTKTSVLQRRSPEHLHAAESTLVKFEAEVRKGPGLDWSRQRALCSLYFFLAQHWVEIGDLREALRVWGICWRRHLLSLPVHITGSGLLTAKRMGRKSELVRRAINKWIGVVRMRSNPALIS